ncbi:membrane protein insertase YidC [Pseudolabrys taiwanensis]|uniref:Membrane protein insertase YidC n=1 Tax=Pseudolabrys taiwanensis TaxID=331696 RepID=A0A346A0Y5_9HYPH|nr:membrane protein insertase YidC [Pseudolabrys taiwanensis]AXK82832.1 membrane protein insertase YidC [Pseudolabrys taiwanensis]
MTDNKNTILAIVLSALVLIGWQYFVGMPQEKARQEQLQQQEQKQAAQPQQPGQPVQAPPQGAPNGQTPQVPGGPTTAPATSLSRAAALAASPRVAIKTDSLEGSIALKGGRIDDLALIKFRETVDPKSPPIFLLSPSGTGDPFYAEFGWTTGGGSNVKVPTADTVWTQSGSGALAVGKPVTLTWDNGEGLEFRRTIAVDDKYVFTLKDEVVNKGGAPVTLYPYGLISRHGTPHTAGYYILHEGLIGVLGDQGLQEYTYKNIDDKKTVNFDVTNGWLGITDKYWAATLLPDTNARLKARFSTGTLGTLKTYQTDYLLDAVTVAPGATGAADARLFAGAKEVAVVNDYEKQLKLNRFDLLIDWGWFYFITKPLFMVIDYLYRVVGNFGVAILIVTLLIKLIFFPLASKSYASMAKMKAVQPQMMALRERYGDDKVKQQQALMELYKKEKINPLAGCLPIAIQIPVFFSLYKVLFVTLEMRHAPFFGWIHDLSSPDPTNLFTLFGLLHYDPTVVPVIGHFLHLGLWPLIMGVTMWLQMKLNPAPPDPTQAMIFNWMPVIFTFMLASFPAGLVIYWAWNNSLSVTQQAFIMSRHGAKIELWDNIKAVFVRKKPQT